MRSWEAANLLRMGDAKEPTTEWGRYLRRQTKRDGWSVARLARDSKIARQTIFEWIRDGGESVTVASVRAITDSLGDELATGLLAAGNISIHETDSEIAAILASDLDAQEQAELIEYVHKLREIQQAARRAEVDARLNRPRRAA